MMPSSKNVPQMAIMVSARNLSIPHGDEITMTTIPSLTEKQFDAAVALMDDNIREKLHAELAPCSNQEFLEAYAKEHERKFGEKFPPATPDMAW